MRFPESLYGGLRPALFLSLGGILILLACSAPGTGGGPAGTQPAPAAQATKPPAATSAPASPGKTASSAPAVSLDACTLLTRAEVEAAVGAPVLDPKKETVGPMVSCTFNDPKTPIFSVVSLTVIIGADAKEARGIFDMGKKDGQAVTGLGDEAYLGPLSNLEVLKGRFEISIDVASSEGKDRLSIAKNLAAKALARLP